MNDCAAMTGKPAVIRFEMGSGFTSTKIVVETGRLITRVPGPGRGFCVKGDVTHANTRKFCGEAYRVVEA